MDAQEAEALENMSQGAFRVWMGDKFYRIEGRLIKLESRRWPWMLAGGGLTGTGIVTYLTGILPKFIHLFI